MAWLFKFKDSKVWWLGYRAHGKQILRSTGKRDRNEAEQELQKVEVVQASDRAGILTRELYESLTGRAAPRIVLKTALEEWVAEASGSASAATAAKYKGLSAALVEFLKADERGPLVDAVTREDIERFLADRLTRVSISTRNLDRKCLSVFFRREVVRGHLRDNPMVAIQKLKLNRKQARLRRPFTPDELRELYRVAPDDFWRYAVLGGFTTGLRLGDLCTMPIGAVDWQRKCLKVLVRKTDKTMTIPLAPAFFDLLTRLRAARRGSPPDEAFWPEQAALYEKSHSAPFSQDFYEKLLIPAGLAKSRRHRKLQKRDGDRRRVNEVSFHCLRHSCVSIHAANSQSQQIVKALAGHSSDEINDLYTKMPQAVLESAVLALPDITAP